MIITLSAETAVRSADIDREADAEIDAKREVEGGREG